MREDRREQQKAELSAIASFLTISLYSDFDIIICCPVYWTVKYPGSFEIFKAGVEEGAAQAYTLYRGRKTILEHVAGHLSAFTGAAIDPAKNIILTPGTQGALFLAMGSNIMPGDKVAIVEPDYFANRKMVEFFHGEMCIFLR